MEIIPEDDSGDREEELQTLTAIFPEIRQHPKNSSAFLIELPVDLDEPLYLERHLSSSGELSAAALVPTVNGKPDQHDEAPPVTRRSTGGVPTSHIQPVNIEALHSVTHLPPLRLKVKLSTGYPSYAPPHVRIDTVIPWLPPVIQHAFEAKAREFWESGGRAGMLFDWISYVQDEITSRVGLPAAIVVDSRIEVVLLDYHARREQRIFEETAFTCPVCLGRKRGKLCHQMFACNHVTCLQCLQDGYGAMIGQGNIGDVKCMHFGCAKRETDDAGKPIGDITISAEELQAIPLTDDQVTRYKRLKRKAAETKSTVYCPRPWCQEPASVSSAGLDPRIKAPRSTLAELAQCTACNFAFCSLCFKSWHGAFLTCKPRDAAKISAEEQATLDYMAAYSSFCPQCMTQVQKTNGCNHMECTMCHTHFCYLCSERLLPKNPYMHFNNRKSRCNNKLWDKEEGDGTDVVRRDPGAEYEVEAVPRNDGPQDGWMGPMGAAAIEDEDEEMMRIFGAMG